MPKRNKKRRNTQLDGQAYSVYKKIKCDDQVHLHYYGADDFTPCDLDSSSNSARASDDESSDERFSSQELPLGMSSEQFARLCYELVEEFGAGQFFGGKVVGYSSPTHLFFKGSSVTGVSYSKEKNGKPFSESSDYDAGLIWPAAVSAYIELHDMLDGALKSYAEVKQPVPNVGLVNLHCKDGKERADKSQRYFFPTGMPHKLFCDHLQQCMRQSHPINFVILDKLSGIKLNPNLLENSRAEKTETFELLEQHVHGNRHVSSSLRAQFASSAENAALLFGGANLASYLPQSGQVLVYSWRLVEKYHAQHANKLSASADPLKLPYSMSAARTSLFASQPSMSIATNKRKLEVERDSQLKALNESVLKRARLATT